MDADLDFLLNIVDTSLTNQSQGLDGWVKPPYAQRGACRKLVQEGFIVEKGRGLYHPTLQGVAACVSPSDMVH